jgi:RNA polymerase sigma-70 factor (ECF subfamily)
MVESSQPREVESWIEGARAGSSEDLGRIAETYRAYLLLIANQELDGRLRGKLGASDLVQETLLQAQLKFDQFRGGSEKELLGWLRAILHNQLIDAGRRYLDADRRQVGRERALAATDNSGAMPIPEQAPSPRAELIGREESAALAQALERLPEEYRQVILLRSWDRLSFAEVGERMNRSEAAAGKLWARAIERLQQELGLPHEP